MADLRRCVPEHVYFEGGWIAVEEGFKGGCAFGQNYLRCNLRPSTISRHCKALMVLSEFPFHGVLYPGFLANLIPPALALLPHRKIIVPALNHREAGQDYG